MVLGQYLHIECSTERQRWSFGISATRIRNLRSTTNTYSNIGKLVEDSQALDEVVVVGYGVQKRASVTGSVASLQAKDIATVKTPNVSNALAGKLARFTCRTKKRCSG